MTTFAGQWGPEIIIGTGGGAQPQAQMTIYEIDGVTLATVYADRDRTPVDNPLPIGVATGSAGTDIVGNATFWAEPDVYVQELRIGGKLLYRSPISCPPDPTEQGGGLPVFPTPPVDPNSIYTIEQTTDVSGDPIGAPDWGDGLWGNIENLNDQINGPDGLVLDVATVLGGLTNGHSLIQFQGAWDSSLVSLIGQAVQASDGNTYVWTEPTGTQGIDPAAFPAGFGWQILPDPSNNLTAAMAFASLTLGYDPSAGALIAPQGSIFLNGTNVFFNVDGGHIWVEITANTLVVGSSHATSFTAPVNQISTVTATCTVTLPSGPANGSVLAIFCTAGAPTVTGTGISDTLAAGDKPYYMWSGSAWVRTSYLASQFLAASARGAANGVASLDGTGKVPSSQLPPVAINEVYVVSSQAAMLALAADVGDVAVQSSGSTYMPNTAFMLSTLPASTLANWIQISEPGQVVSVNGQQGAVTGLAELLSPVFTGTPTVPDPTGPTGILNRETGDGRYVMPSRQVITTGGSLTGGGALTTDLTLDLGANEVDYTKLAAFPYFFGIGATDQNIPGSQWTPVAFTRATQADVGGIHPINSSTTTIAAGSNTATLPQGTIHVASTAGFPAATTGIPRCAAVTIGGVLVVFSYTGTSGGNAFTGCTLGVGTLATGQTVIPANEFFFTPTIGNYAATSEMHWAPSPVGRRKILWRAMDGVFNLPAYRSSAIATNEPAPDYQALQISGMPTPPPPPASWGPSPLRIEVYQDSPVSLLLKQDGIMAPTMSEAYMNQYQVV